MLDKLAKQKCISQIVFAAARSLHARLLRLCFDCTQALNLYTICHFYPLYADTETETIPDRDPDRDPDLQAPQRHRWRRLANRFWFSFLQCSICSHCLFMAYLWQRLSKHKTCQTHTCTHTETPITCNLTPLGVKRLVSRANCVIASRVAGKQKSQSTPCQTQIHRIYPQYLIEWRFNTLPWVKRL